MSGATTALDAGVSTSPLMAVRGFLMSGERVILDCYGPSAPPWGGNTLPWPLLLIVGWPGLALLRVFSQSPFPPPTLPFAVLLFSLFILCLSFHFVLFLVGRANLVHVIQHVVVLPCAWVYPIFRSSATKLLPTLARGFSSISLLGSVLGGPGGG